MADIEKLYGSFQRFVSEVSRIQSALAALEWDMETMMPPAGAAARSEVMSTLSGIAHDRSVSSEYADVLRALKEALNRGELSGVRAANVAQAWETFERESKLPGDFVRELTAVTGGAHHVWAKARKSGYFLDFLPDLRRIIELKRQEAALVGFTGSPYDALLDCYEPGATAAGIEVIFAPLQVFLKDFVRRLAAAPHPPDKSARIFAPRAVQERLGRLVAEAMGFDFNAGRLDMSAHPFTTKLHPGDVRITSRYDESNLLKSLMGTIHEAGHGIYDLALPADQYGMAAGSAASYGIHESQSRLWENMVGRSRAFWQFLMPSLQAEGLSFRGNAEELYRAVNAVRPSFIRVEADEVTYGLHICLRFGLERDLMEGRLEAADLPEAWNGRFRDLFGLDVPDPARGVLQDVHWSGGMFGYFPSYALGNLYAAQLYDAVLRDRPGLEDGFRAGEFLPLRDWLNHRVHQFGAVHEPARLIAIATGAPPDPSYFTAYIERKYGEIYGL